MKIAIFLAFCMTLITASSNVILKKGFLKIKPFMAVYASVVISTIFLWITTLLFEPGIVFTNYRGILIFVLIGSFAPTLVRNLTYLGIHKLGAGRAAPLRATTAFFATIFAILVLNESSSWGIFLGIFLIIFGIRFLAKKDKEDTFPWKFRHFFYPLSAAVLAGIAANLRKYGLNLMPHPIFASTVAASSAFVILTIYAFMKYSKQDFLELRNHSRELKFIFIAALLTSCGEIVDLSALLFGKVTLVVPIFATTPLMIVIFSRIFLKKQEVITKNLVLSAVLIIFGVFIAVTNALTN